MYIYYGLIPYYTMQEEPLPLSNLIRSHVSMESTRMKESSGFLRLRLCSGHTSLVYPGIPEQPHRSCQLEAGFFTIQSVRLKRVIIFFLNETSGWTSIKDSRRCNEDPSISTDFWRKKLNLYKPIHLYPTKKKKVFLSKVYTILRVNSNARVM